MQRVKIAINGFGRIGRNVFRAAQGRKDVQVVGINDMMPVEAMAYLLRYDSTQGRYPGLVEHDENHLIVDGVKIPITRFLNPKESQWVEEPDVVIESTGVFTQKESPKGGYGDHLKGGVKFVVLTAPAKDAIDTMVVLGVNDNVLSPKAHFISNASCTTNCLAPVVKVLHRELGIDSGFMTTVHSYTNDQRVLDGGHSDLRRARAAAVSQIPTTTGAAKAIGKIIPELNGKLDGVSIRVPTPTGSLVDLVCNVKKSATIADINAMIKAEANKPEMKAILAYTEDPIVSADIVHDSHSSIFDALSTKVIGNLVKVLSWYDNEWGYSNRVIDICVKAMSL